MCGKNDNANFGAQQDVMLRRSNTRNTPSHGLKRRSIRKDGNGVGRRLR
jgi:hypothetical protein